MVLMAEEIATENYDWLLIDIAQPKTRQSKEFVFLSMVNPPYFKIYTSFIKKHSKNCNI